MYSEIDTPEWHTVNIGNAEIKYYVREPAPDQWNAIGVINLPDGRGKPARRCPLIVGTGGTYYEAIGDLIARALGGNHPDLPKRIVERRRVEAPEPVESGSTTRGRTISVLRLN